MQRRKFLRVPLAIGLTSLAGMGLSGMGEESANGEKVVSTEEFPIPRKIESVVEWTEGESMILMSGGHQIKLNDAGKFLWGHIDGKTCTDQLASFLAEEYGIEPKEAAVDADLFVVRMQREGFLQVIDFGRRITIEKSIEKKIEGRER